MLSAAVVHATPANADRAYVYDSFDRLGDMTAARISDNGKRLKFLSARVQMCKHGTLLSDTFRVVRHRPARLPDWQPVLVNPRIKGKRLDARVLRRIRYDDGTETWTGRLRLRKITGRSARGTWSIKVKWAPRGRAVRRCSTRTRFRMERDGDWYVGDTSHGQPVAVHDEGSGVYPLIAYWADCQSGDFVSGLYGTPWALENDGDFGSTTPMDYITAALDFNPATVVVNGHLDDAHASGNFDLTVLWDGTDRCATGAQTWTAVRG
jgi:hypothetical protein